MNISVKSNGKLSLRSIPLKIDFKRSLREEGATLDFQYFAPSIFQVPGLEFKEESAAVLAAL